MSIHRGKRPWYARPWVYEEAIGAGLGVVLALLIAAQNWTGVVILLVCVLVFAGTLWVASELFDKRRAFEDVGEYQDLDADPIDNRPRGPLRWLY